MRYPRTVFVFDTPSNGIDVEYFQMISSSSQAIYIKDTSKPIQTLNLELKLIHILDGYFNFTGPARTYMAIGNFNKVEFLATALADKNCSIYWLIDKSSAVCIRDALDALLDLQAMESDLNDALYLYSGARERYQILINSQHISKDQFPQLIADILNGKQQVELRADIENFLRKELCINQLTIQANLAAAIIGVSFE